MRSFREGDLFELRDLRIKGGRGREGTGGTKVPRASMVFSRPRNTTCALCSEQEGKRCKKRAERWAGASSHRALEAMGAGPA